MSPLLPGLVWGKHRGLRGRVYPLEAHLLDTAAAARLLVRDLVTASQRDVLAASGVAPGQAGLVAAVLAARHDVGKCAPGFQALTPESFSALTGGPVPSGIGPVGHAMAGFAHLIEQAIADGSYAADPRAVLRAAQVVGGHHGVYPGAEHWTADGLDAGTWGPRLEGSDPALAGRWRATRALIVSRVEEVVGWPGQAVPRLSIPAAALLTGVVVVADWLMSQVEVIAPAMPLLPDPEALDLEALRGHYERATARAEEALTVSGLVAPRLRHRPFEAQFPGYTPRGPQVTAADDLPGLVKGPGLLVLAAPTGDGKSEAALHAASVMAEVTGASGVLMALPTMATTDAMFRRVSAFTVTGYDGPTRLSLMHSMAALNLEYESSTTLLPTSAEESPEGLAEVTSWIRGPKRPVLAPSSVATVDQVLALALRGKWMPLRLLGVTRKVVVVDEAHTYDAYMQTLLRRVLTWLAACGVPVVLLSATLSGRLARSLADAYRAGLPHALTAGAPDGGDLVPSYPGWLYVDATTGQETAGPIPVTDRATMVEVSLREYPANRVTDPAGLVTAVHDVVAPVAAGRADGNVLVVCNTVPSAVAVYDMLEPLARTSGTPLLLMHSRFPVAARLRHADEVNRLYGKGGRLPDPETGVVARPVRSVLIATQVVEQSLDLDMDHLVTDLAPLAMLIQRVGRVHRHPVNATVTANAPDDEHAAQGPRAAVRERPVAYQAPGMTVLAPMTTSPDGSRALADRDERPYDQILLQRTHTALAEHLIAAPGIAVPGDVQALIDEVYGRDFTTDVDAAGQVLQAATAAQVRIDVREGTAHLAAIPAPHAVQSLTELTSRDDADTALGRHGARYGMDTTTVIPVWGSPESGLWLDAAKTIPLPGASGTLTRAAVRVVVEHSIRVPTGPGWARALTDAQAAVRPPQWDRDPYLSDARIVRFTVLAASAASTAMITPRVEFRLDADRGLTMHTLRSGA